MDANSDTQKKMEMQQNLALIEGVAKKKMTRDAIARYGAVKLSHPENAIKAIVAIAQAAEQGMKETIDDAKFKQILVEINNARK